MEWLLIFKNLLLRVPRFFVHLSVCLAVSLAKIENLKKRIERKTSGFGLLLTSGQTLGWRRLQQIPKSPVKGPEVMRHGCKRGRDYFCGKSSFESLQFGYLNIFTIWSDTELPENSAQKNLSTQMVAAGHSVSMSLKEITPPPSLSSSSNPNGKPSLSSSLS